MGEGEYRLSTSYLFYESIKNYFWKRKNYELPIKYNLQKRIEFNDDIYRRLNDLAVYILIKEDILIEILIHLDV